MSPESRLMHGCLGDPHCSKARVPVPADRLGISGAVSATSCWEQSSSLCCRACFVLGAFCLSEGYRHYQKRQKCSCLVGTAWGWLYKDWNMMKKGVGKEEIANITGDSQSFTCPGACWGVRKVVYVPRSCESTLAVSTLPLTIRCLY